MNETLLVIEDDRLNAELLRRRLEKQGYNVIECTNGLDAARWLKLHHPDLILMDLSLKGLNGWSLTKELKSNLQTCQIPVLAVTAHAMPEDRAKALGAGCDEYLTKPVNFKLLFEMIERLLAGRSGP